MKLVFLALMMASGVFFGILALVVDLGYGMDQQGVMQNAADAGSLAAAQLMAGSVALNSAGQPVYAVSDNEVNSKAQQFVDYNKSSAKTAVEYLGWSGTCVSFSPRTFTYASDPSLIPAGAVRSVSTAAASTSLNSIPTNTCGVRVFANVTYDSMFAAAPPIGISTEGATASAAARIAPTSAPTTFGDVWPITHYEDPANPDPACAFEIGGCALPFWDSHGTANFKYLVDMSKRSGLNTARDQLFAPNLGSSPLLTNDCATLSLFNFQPCYDPKHPGSNDKQADVNYWLANGWHGQIYVPVDPNDPTKDDTMCTNVSRVISSCPNSRLEMFGGDLGNNAADPMRAYLNSYPDQTLDPTCNCLSATVNVFFWRWGEQNIDVTTNIGSIWGNSSKDKSNNLQRMVVDKVRRFRFNAQTIGSSSVSGYFVGFYVPNGTPSYGAPSNTANTVILIG